MRNSINAAPIGNAVNKNNLQIQTLLFTTQHWKHGTLWLVFHMFCYDGKKKRRLTLFVISCMYLLLQDLISKYIGWHASSSECLEAAAILDMWCSHDTTRALLEENVMVSTTQNASSLAEVFFCFTCWPHDVNCVTLEAMNGHMASVMAVIRRTPSETRTTRWLLLYFDERSPTGLPGILRGVRPMISNT